MSAKRRVRRVLILMAHTGSGHLRAAEAVTEVLRRRYGAAAAVEMLDAVGLYAPFPFNRLADVYPWWIDRAAITWELGYRLTDGRRRAMAVLVLFWPLIWPRARQLLQRHPADVIVSLHPLTNHYIVWTLARMGRAVPTVTLVTDPVSVHSFWLSPWVDRYLVGSPQARQKALACGLTEEQVCVTGLPVNPSFVDGLTDKSSARHVLGWSVDQPVVLLLGGGEGMGRLYRTACAIDATCSGIQLTVVAGRNRRLQDRLEKTDWRSPAHIFGFVDHTREMPRLMSAADVLVTKAGPGSLYEAFLAGLPLILNGSVPGQEDGNIRMVVEGGAGIWAPDPSRAAAAVAQCLDSEQGRLAHMVARSRALARPGAADTVADHVWEMALTNL
jgi:1,2-diacylglycerol 3-beta-galactosyltransferase